MNSVILSSKRLRFYAWAIWFTAALFYAIEFLQRVSPSVMAIPLMHTFAINPARLSFIISLYFYAYALAQIPVGMMLDRFGAKRLLTLACVVVSLSSLLFAVSESLWVLAIARILIGFASAFAFLGVLKLAAVWFSERQYPFIVGLTNTIGVAGAILGEAPLAKLVETTGWQNSMIILALIGFGVSVALWLVITDCPICLIPNRIKQVTTSTNRVVTKSVWYYLRPILQDKQTWFTALYAGGMVAPVIALGELWAVPFLINQFHLTQVAAATVNSALFIGIACGGPINGLLAARLNNKKRLMQIGNIIAFLCLLFLMHGRNMNSFGLFGLLFVFGFATSSMLLAFMINKDRFNADHSATVTAFTNIIIVISGSVFQDILGFLLKHFNNNMLQLNYHDAFRIVPVISLLCLLLLLFIKMPEQNKE